MKLELQKQFTLSEKNIKLFILTKLFRPTSLSHPVRAWPVRLDDTWFIASMLAVTQSTRAQNGIWAGIFSLPKPCGGSSPFRALGATNSAPVSPGLRLG